jgi:hypothetical protein
MRSPQRDYWREAIAKELAGLLALETWEMVPASSMPPGANLMHCHYVFTVKRKADGSIEKFKARLVADGNTQKHGIDFDRVFATVVKSLRYVSSFSSPRLGIATSLPLISGRPTYRASWILTCHSTCDRPQMCFPSISTGTRWCASCGDLCMVSSRLVESGLLSSPPSSSRGA